jgi:hypothetical protein
MVAGSENYSDSESPRSPMSPGSVGMNEDRNLMSIQEMPEDSQMMGGIPPHSALFCSRKQREFTPDSKKDDTYWDRRRRNNAAAKRSREKRRLNDMLLEKRVIQLSRENHILRAQTQAVQQSYGIRAEALIDMDQVMATLPSEDQLLNMTCSPSSGSRRGMNSPPPLPATMIALPNRPNTPPHHPMEQSPNSPTSLDEVYRQCLNATQSSLGIKEAATRALQYYSGPPQKRFCPSSYIEEDSRTPSTGSSEVAPEDALNLTCKSRSRSDSDSEPSMRSDSISASSEEEMQHHLPHKMRLKFHQESELKY